MVYIYIGYDKGNAYISRHFHVEIDAYCMLCHHVDGIGNVTIIPI